MLFSSLVSRGRHIAWLIAVVGVFGADSFAEAGNAKKPNIVVILADDLGYADVGFHGCKDIPTPNLDALAKQGVRCTNGYVSGPYCSPTRAGLLTGRYQTRFGHEFNPGGGKQGLPVDQTTMAQYLKKLGYVTALVGKWHLGGEPNMHPMARGFDEFFGFLGGAHSYFPAKEKGDTILRGKKPAGEKDYLTDALAREAVSFIDRNADKPFFLYLAFNAVHTPMHATDKYLDRFAKIQDKQRRTYAAMLSAMDDAVGQVLARLRDKGLEENTLIFFFSDNGGPTMVGTTINGSSNYPLRGSKRTLWEGGVRVPFLVAWKGKLPAGKTYDHPVIALDVLPTALAAAGLDAPPASSKIDGVNLLPYLTGKKTEAPHDMLFWRFGQMMAVRKGDWKLVRVDGPALHLFNLKSDIGESKDVAQQHADLVQELQTAWNRWNESNVPPLWGGAGAKKKNKAKD